MVNDRYKSTDHTLYSESLILVNGVEGGVLHSLNEDHCTDISFVNPQAGSHFLIQESTVEPGSVLYVRPNGLARTVFSPNSSDNVLFVTEQCNNQCIMCSQPPSKKRDIDLLYQLNTKLLHLIPSSTPSLGITGGEPTLLAGRLVELIALVFEVNPELSLAMLSNGRAFANKKYTSCFEQFNNHNLITGIPLHSDFEMDHDAITTKIGSYNQTMAGLYNMALFDMDVEIRIVITRINYRRLAKMASYIFKNLPFVAHVAFMGLEFTGLALKNSASIYVDPIDYYHQLEEAVTELSDWGIRTSVYNIPLCLLSPKIHRYAVRSISDWKESYGPKCQNCIVKGDCCGLFATSRIQSENIKAFV